jgi:hypothetical protein
MGAIQEALERFGEETVQIIRSNLASTGTDATGKTSQSLKSELPKPNQVIVSGRGFIYTVETGRKPGKMPPVNKILEWVNSGKISIEGKAESVAWAISKNIAKFGTKLFREGGRTDIITPAVSDQRVQNLTDEIANIAQDQIVKVIEENTNG